MDCGADFNSGVNGILLLNPLGTQHYTFTGAALTGTYALTFPLITGNDSLAALGVAQTFSVVQTFSASGTSIVSNNGINISSTTSNGSSIYQLSGTSTAGKLYFAGNDSATGKSGDEVNLLSNHNSNSPLFTLQYNSAGGSVVTTTLNQTNDNLNVYDNYNSNYIFTVTVGGKVTTLQNTLDDGMGNHSVAGVSTSKGGTANGTGSPSALTVISVGASTFTYTNATPYDIVVYIGSAQIVASQYVTDIAVNGTDLTPTFVPSTLTTIILRVGDYVTVQYSHSAPSMWYKML